MFTKCWHTKQHHAHTKKKKIQKIKRKEIIIIIIIIKKMDENNKIDKNKRYPNISKQNHTVDFVNRLDERLGFLLFVIGLELELYSLLLLLLLLSCVNPYARFGRY